METKYKHQAVLLHQAVDSLIGSEDGFYVDGTFGRGGHSEVILERLSSKGRLLVIDKDLEAIAEAERLYGNDERVLIRHGSFSEMAQFVDELGFKSKVNGILLDLGVSSPQLDDAQRGFSFNKDGPLDMRMNTSAGVSAQEWLAVAEESEIANVIYEFGEERFSRRMAKAIVRERSVEAIVSTLRLAEIIKVANPAWEKHKHPATRAFQGIRIFINNELSDLHQCLAMFPEMLMSKGRMVIISFHSLEDRMVKQFIQKQVKGDDYPVDLPIMQSQLNPKMKKIGKPIKGNSTSNEDNVRARSAVMRVAERL